MFEGRKIIQNKFPLQMDLRRFANESVCQHFLLFLFLIAFPYIVLMKRDSYLRFENNDLTLALPFLITYLHGYLTKSRQIKFIIIINLLIIYKLLL